MWLKSAIPIASHSSRPAASARRLRAAALAGGSESAANTCVPRRPARSAQQRAEQRPAEQQAGERLQAQALARERADAGEQARGEGGVIGICSRSACVRSG